MDSGGAEILIKSAERGLFPLWIKGFSDSSFHPSTLDTEQATWITGPYIAEVLRHLIPELPAGRIVYVGQGPMDRAKVPPAAIVIHRGDEHAMPLPPLPPTVTVFKEYGVRHGFTMLRQAPLTAGLVGVVQEASLDLIGLVKSKLKASGRRVLPIPVGYAVPVDRWGELDDQCVRPIDVCFAGSVRHSTKWRSRDLLGTPKERARRRMLSALDGLGADGGVRVVVRHTRAFGDVGDGEDAYARLLCGAKIAVCPRGTSQETFRHFEAAMAGCIVVSEPLPDHWFYADAPFLYLRDWSELGRVVHDLLHDSNKLRAIAKQTRQWWLTCCAPEALADRLLKYADNT